MGLLQDLRLDVADHTYYFRNRPVPGVTRVLDDIFGELYKVPKEVLENAREIGELVDAAVTLDCTEGIDEDTIDPDISGHWRAWELFKQECNPKVTCTQRMVYHPAYGYAGTLDLMAHIGGHFGTLDVKSGMELPQHELQVVAYAEAESYRLSEINAKTSRPKRQWVLYLSKDGTYKLKTVKEPDKLFNIFVSALVCWKFKQGGLNGARR